MPVDTASGHASPSQEIPFSLPRILVRPLAGHRAAPRRATCTWSRTRPACTRSCAGPHRRRPSGSETTIVGTPEQLRWRSGRRRDRGDVRRDRHRAAARRGTRPALRAPQRRTDPVQRHLLLPRPGGRPHVFTSYETGRRYRITVLRGAFRRARRPGAGRGRPRRGPRARCDRQLGDRDRGVRQRRGRRSPPAEPFDEVAARRRRASSPRSSTRSRRGAPTAPRPPNWPRTCCGRPPSRPAGFLARPAVLMSKHWMDKVWSWDHCFNALALAAGRPGAGLGPVPDCPSTTRTRRGALPDSVTHSEVLYNFVKPPIHGWALRGICADGCPSPSDRAELQRDLRPAGRWTTFWLDARRAPGHAAAALPARQRQRLGQRHHLRPRRGSDRDRRPRRVPASCSCANSPTWPASSGERRPDAAGTQTRRPGCGTRMLEQLWDGGAVPARGPHTGRDRDQRAACST